MFYGPRQWVMIMIIDYDPRQWVTIIDYDPCQWVTVVDTMALVNEL